MPGEDFFTFAEPDPVAPTTPEGVDELVIEGVLVVLVDAIVEEIKKKL